MSTRAYGELVKKVYWSDVSPLASVAFGLVMGISEPSPRAFREMAFCAMFFAAVDFGGKRTDYSEIAFRNSKSRAGWAAALLALGCLIYCVHFGGMVLTYMLTKAIFY